MDGLYDMDGSNDMDGSRLLVGAVDGSPETDGWLVGTGVPWSTHSQTSPLRAQVLPSPQSSSHCPIQGSGRQSQISVVGMFTQTSPSPQVPPHAGASVLEMQLPSSAGKHRQESEKTVHLKPEGHPTPHSLVQSIIFNMSVSSGSARRAKILSSANSMKLRSRRLCSGGDRMTCFPRRFLFSDLIVSSSWRRYDASTPTRSNETTMGCSNRCISS